VGPLKLGYDRRVNGIDYADACARTYILLYLYKQVIGEKESIGLCDSGYIISRRASTGGFFLLG
jgi:hypothetical protein